MNEEDQDVDRRRTGVVVAAGGLAYLLWRARRRRNAPSLQGQVVLITGGSRGLGLLVAREFARDGCRIAICARDEVELENAKRKLRKFGTTALAVRCDVGRQDQVETMVRRVTDHYGRIDILVNNAGIIQVGPIESMTVDDFDRAMKVIFWGSLYTTLAVLPQMADRGEGRIVNVTSIGGKVAIPHLLPYDAAKFALVGLSDGLRPELRRFGIRVTTVVPGLMRTGSPVNSFFKGDAEKEFTWFSLGAATPLTAMHAGRAARRIVDATRRGEAEVTLTWQAKMLRLAQELLPATVSAVLTAVNRRLPQDGQPAEHRGMHLATPLAPSPITALMNRAAIRNNEFGGKARPTREHAAKVGLRKRRVKSEE